MGEGGERAVVGWVGLIVTFHFLYFGRWILLYYIWGYVFLYNYRLIVSSVC
jgi:hypothetical protein